MIKITFPDGSVREYAKGTTAYQIAESISPRLAADSLAAAVNGATVDMTRPIEEDASVKFYKWDDEEGKHAFWHTSSHLLAEALEALYPGIKFGIGPAIENGFYYDVDSPTPITEADLPTIENKMVELSRNKEALLRREVPKAEALKTFTEKGDQYKVELITDLEDGTISFYTNGAFTDLCRGPHIPNTGYIKALKLTSVAGAYWRGNEKNKMLTRIYGISFPKKSMLDEYLAMMEEAKKRDHRKLGKDLELFTFSQRVGQGLPLWLPKGAALRDRLAPKAVLHVDGVQGFMRLPFSLKKLGVQSYALSGHKIHGPKGVGALVWQDGFRFRPQIVGGGQQDDLRSGTENTCGIAGLREGVRYIRRRTTQRIYAEEERLMRRLAVRLNILPGLRVYYSDKNDQSGVLSVVPENMSCDALSARRGGDRRPVRAALRAARA